MAGKMSLKAKPPSKPASKPAIDLTPSLASRPKDATEIPIPARLSRECRGQLPDYATSIADLHLALGKYLDSKKAEKFHADLAKAYREKLEPVAREAYARLWVERGSRPKPPVVLVNDVGESLPFVVQQREQGELSEELAHGLLELVGQEDYARHVQPYTAIEFDPQALSQPGVTAKVREALSAAGVGHVYREVRRYRFRSSIEGTLTDLAGRGWCALARGLKLLQPLVRQYFQIG